MVIGGEKIMQILNMTVNLLSEQSFTMNLLSNRALTMFMVKLKIFSFYYKCKHFRPSLAQLELFVKNILSIFNWAKFVLN